MGFLDFLFGSPPDGSVPSATAPLTGEGAVKTPALAPAKMTYGPPTQAQEQQQFIASLPKPKPKPTPTPAGPDPNSPDNQGMAGRMVNDVLGALVKMPLHLLGPVPTAGNADELDLAKDLAARGDHEGAQKQLDSYYQRIQEGKMNDEVLGYPTKTSIADQLYPEGAPAQIFRSVVKSIPDLAAQAGLYGLGGLAEKGGATGLAAVGGEAAPWAKLLAKKAGEAGALSLTFSGIKSSNPKEFAINSAKDFAVLFPTLVGLHVVGLGAKAAKDAINPYLEKGTTAMMDLINTAENAGVDITPKRFSEYLDGEQDPEMEQIWQKLPQDSKTLFLQSHVSENRLLSLKNPSEGLGPEAETRLAKLTGPEQTGEPQGEAGGGEEKISQGESTPAPLPDQSGEADTRGKLEEILSQHKDLLDSSQGEEYDRGAQFKGEMQDLERKGAFKFSGKDIDTLDRDSAVKLLKEAADYHEGKPIGAPLRKLVNDLTSGTREGGEEFERGFSEGSSPTGKSSVLDRVDAAVRKGILDPHQEIDENGTTLKEWMDRYEFHLDQRAAKTAATREGGLDLQSGKPPEIPSGDMAKGGEAITDEDRPPSPSDFPPQGKADAEVAQKILSGEGGINDVAKAKDMSPGAVSQKSFSQILREQNPEADSIEDIGRKTTPLSQKVGIWDRFLATPTKVLEKIGWGDKARALQDADISYNNDLRTAIDQLKGWIKQFPEGGVGGASDTRIFEFINGVKQEDGSMIHPALTDPAEQKIASEMQAEFAKYAKAFGITPDENYVTHIFDRSAQGVEFPEDIEKMIRDQVPGSVYDPFLLQRKGAEGFQESAAKAMEAYVKRATRKLNFDPVLEDMSNSMGDLEASQADYVKHYLERVNMRPDAIELNLNNSIKNGVGYRLGDRPTLTVLGTVRKMYTRALIGLNQLTPIKHFLFQGTNIYSQLGERGTLSGMATAISNIASGNVDEYADAGIFTARNIAEDRTISAVNSIGDNMDKALFFQLDNTLKFLRATAYEGGKAQYLDENPNDLEGAIQAGKDMVDKTVFNFGRINTPMALQNDIVKTVLPFQSYTLKQAEFLKDMVGSALKGDKAQIAASIRWGAAATVILSTVAKALGLDWKDFAPGMKLFDSNSVTPPSAKYGGTAGNILSATPVAQPFFAVKGAIENAPDQYGRTQKGNVLQRIIGSPDVQNEAVNMLPGGNQIRKTLQGLQAIQKGQVRSKTGKTKLFSVHDDPLNVIRALMLGKYGTKEGRDYIEKLNAGKQKTAPDPNLPNLPDLPQLPDLPNLPNLPDLPDLPSLK